MSIEEITFIRENRIELEAAISDSVSNLIRQFETKTETSVSGVSIEIEEARCASGFATIRRFTTNVYVKNPYND